MSEPAGPLVAATAGSRWRVALRGAAVTATLSAPAGLVLAGAAVMEHAARLLSIAGALIAASAVVGAMASTVFANFAAGTDSPNHEGRRAPVIVSACIIGGVLIRLAVFGSQAIARLPADDELRYAIDSLTGFLWPLLVGAGALSAVLALTPPASVEEQGMRLGSRLPLVRGRTIVGIGIVISLATVSMSGLARERFGSRDPAVAATQRPLLEQRARRWPTHEPTRYLLGMTYLTLNQNDRAISELTRAVALDPRDGWAQNDLGWALMAVGRVAESVPHFREAESLLPDDQRPGRNLATAYDRLRQPAAAESVYRAMEVRWPRDVELVALAGLMRFEDGPRETGAAEVRRAFDIDSTNAMVHFAMAQVLTTQARLSEALPHYRAYLAANEWDVGTRARYAIVASLNGDADVARTALERIEKQAPGLINQYPALRSIVEHSARPSSGAR